MTPIPVTVMVEPHLMDTGIWCHVCNLPSAVRIVFTLQRNPTVRIGESTACTDCGAIGS